VQDWQTNQLKTLSRITAGIGSMCVLSHFGQQDAGGEGWDAEDMCFRLIEGRRN
jgi:hypothetical protein